MRIRNRLVQPGREPYIIAELGVNHDGDLDTARALVEAAREADADAVKLQWFDADTLLGAQASLTQGQRDTGEDDVRDMLRRLQLSPRNQAEVIRRAHEVGLHAIVTVFSLEHVDDAHAAGPDAFKTASPDVVNRPLIESLSATGLPMIISTGAASLGEAVRAGAWLRGHDAALLQCVSCYPTPDADAALAGVRALAEATGLPAGYSDHTRAVDTGAIAVAAGACLLEKHLTLDCSRQGPDHAASLEPDDMAEYVRLARRAHRMVGAPGKVVQSIERDVRQATRQSLTANRDLPAGHTLAREDLVVRRPGVGLEPWLLGEVIGRRLVRGVRAGHALTHGHLAINADEAAA